MGKYEREELREKLLLLLLSGMALGLSYSAKTYIKTITNIPRAWKQIEQEKLKKLIREFKYERLINFKENSNGDVTIILTENGTKKALKYKLEQLKIPESFSWDKKWRVVIFDIPEKKKGARESFRKKLINLGFKKIQQSVYIYPYPCKNEIDFVVEFFNLRPYIYFIETKYITNEAKFKLIFNFK